MIHLVRMGDVIQTLTVVDALTAALPDAEIHFMVEAGSAFFPQRHPNIARTIIFDAQKHPDLMAGVADWNSFNYETRALVDLLNAQRYDRIVNLQHKAIAPQLLKYLLCTDKRGSQRNSKNHTVICDTWTKLIFLMAKKRAYMAVNLVEAYATIAGAPIRYVKETLRFTADEEVKARCILQDVRIFPGERYVCLQTGASREWRRWPAESFRTLANRMVTELGCKVLLLGTKSESEINERIRAGNDAIINMCGKTDLAMLSLILKQSAMLVTNDTGTMHLAAYMDTPIVALGMSEISANETAPLSSAKTVYLQPFMACYPCEDPSSCKDRWQCRMRLTNDAVWNVVCHVWSGADIVAFPRRFAALDIMYPVVERETLRFCALEKRQLVDAKVISEIIRLSLMPIWQQAVAAGDICVNPHFIWKQVRDRFVLNGVRWESVIHQFKSEKETFEQRLTHALMVLHDFQLALVSKDTTQRQGLTEQLKIADAAIIATGGMLRIFADYYELECKLMGTEESMLTGVLERTHATIVSIKESLSVLERVVLYCWEHARRATVERVHQETSDAQAGRKA